MRFLGLIAVISSFMLTGCFNTTPKVVEYNKEFADKYTLRKISYLNRHYDYFRKKKYNVKINGPVVKMDEIQNQWLFILDEDSQEQVLVYIDAIPTENRPEKITGRSIVVAGKVEIDKTLMTNYHLNASAFYLEAD